MSARAWDAVLFDFGGTLDGDGVHWSRRFDRVFRSQGLRYPPERLDAAFRESEEFMNADPSVREMSLPEMIRRQTGYLLERLELDGAGVAGEAAEHLIRETRDNLARNAGALRALRGRARLAVLSNFTGNLERILRDEGLLPLVDRVFDSAVVGLRKPDAALFRFALAGIESEPARTAMVGDSVEMDMLPARALGMATVWVEGEAPRPRCDFRPDFTVRSVREVPPLLGSPA